MTNIKKTAVILAVCFAAGIGAGFAAFHYVADIVQMAQEASNERD